MAGLEPLIALIYHEKQQRGSMLCAQHALNNALQGNYFSAPDLSEHARRLDTLEESYDDANTGRKSTNMDDTGFFSVQVLENALNVMGLSLVRWRSMDMRQYHDHPHTQLAFILNLQQHWFTLRRFGPALPDASADPGHGHWFNLNSFLEAPEWVGKLYLGMVLHQAEEEGYSVFAITQADPNKPLALPRTDADLRASELSEPTSATPSARLSTTTTASSANAKPTPTPASQQAIGGFEDEDMDLQAVLQASLMGVDPDPVYPPPPLVGRSFVPLPPDSGSRPGSGPGSGADTPTHLPRHHSYGVPGEVDKVAESMARNRAIMARMQREQEMAQRELYIEEISRHNALSGANAEGEDNEEEDDDDDEEAEEERIRNAITESRAVAHVEGHGQPDDDDEDEDDEAENLRTTAMDWVRNYRLPARMATGSSHREVRVYDDDDEALQCALKASLEAVPPGFVMPDLRGSVPPRMPPDIDDSIPELVEVASDDQETETASEAGASIVSFPSSDATHEVEDVSVDELRRRRLARFGG